MAKSYKIHARYFGNNCVCLSKPIKPKEVHKDMVRLDMTENEKYRLMLPPLKSNVVVSQWDLKSETVEEDDKIKSLFDIPSKYSAKAEIGKETLKTDARLQGLFDIRTKTSVPVNRESQAVFTNSPTCSNQSREESNLLSTNNKRPYQPDREEPVSHISKFVARTHEYSGSMNPPSFREEPVSHSSKFVARADEYSDSNNPPSFKEEPVSHVSKFVDRTHEYSGSNNPPSFKEEPVSHVSKFVDRSHEYLGSNNPPSFREEPVSQISKFVDRSHEYLGSNNPPSFREEPVSQISKFVARTHEYSGSKNPPSFKEESVSHVSKFVDRTHEYSGSNNPPSFKEEPVSHVSKFVDRSHEYLGSNNPPSFREEPVSQISKFVDRTHEYSGSNNPPSFREEPVSQISKFVARTHEYSGSKNPPSFQSQHIYERKYSIPQNSFCMPTKSIEPSARVTQNEMIQRSSNLERLRLDPSWNNKSKRITSLPASEEGFECNTSVSYIEAQKSFQSINSHLMAIQKQPVKTTIDVSKNSSAPGSYGKTDLGNRSSYLEQQKFEANSFPVGNGRLLGVGSSYQRDFQGVNTWNKNNAHNNQNKDKWDQRRHTSPSQFECFGNPGAEFRNQSQRTSNEAGMTPFRIEERDGGNRDHVYKDLSRSTLSGMSRSQQEPELRGPPETRRESDQNSSQFSRSDFYRSDSSRDGGIRESDNYRRSETNYRRPETDYRRSETDNRRSETDNRRSETDFRRSETDNRRSETDFRRQETNYRSARPESSCTGFQRRSDLRDSRSNERSRAGNLDRPGPSTTQSNQLWSKDLKRSYDQRF